jgi:Holliday junction resolvase RusA-like endonuclease
MPRKVEFAADGSLATFWASVPGNPGDAKVNGWKTPIKVGKTTRMIEGKRYRVWKDRASLAFRARAQGRKFDRGPLRASVIAYWPRMTKQGAASGLAFGDVDAVAKAVLDALEAAGVVETDAQIVDVYLSKSYSADEPRIEVEVMRA